MNETITIANLRELDAIVASRIFGIKVQHNNFDYWVATEDGGAILNQYSSDIACAWRIAQKLGIAMIPQSDGETFQWFACDVQTVMYGGDITIAVKDESSISMKSAPLAICLAGLLSIGIEVDLGNCI